jgi:stage V sporulation protein R
MHSGCGSFSYIEEIADKGKYSIEFKNILDANQREKYDRKTGSGLEFIFNIRENFNDFMFVNTFVDQDFVTRNKLFVAGKRINQAKMVYEYYVKSRNAEDYRRMLLDGLYHPPHITVNEEKSTNSSLYLVHHFEGKPLVSDYIPNTMLGIEYLWGGPVHLETSEVESIGQPPVAGTGVSDQVSRPEIRWQRVLYTMDKRKLTRRKM